MLKVAPFKSHSSKGKQSTLAVLKMHRHLCLALAPSITAQSGGFGRESVLPRLVRIAWLKKKKKNSMQRQGGRQKFEGKTIVHFISEPFKMTSRCRTLRRTNIYRTGSHEFKFSSCQKWHDCACGGWTNKYFGLHWKVWGLLALATIIDWCCEFFIFHPHILF